jgi:hypothetical protein
MTNIMKYGLLSFCVLLTLACSVEKDTEKYEIFGKWALKQVAYPDGTHKEFEINSGNYVEIGRGYVVEIMAEDGETNYSYSRQGNNLNLLAGDEIVTWVIGKHEKNEMEIDTPVGRYILSRHSEAQPNN